MNNKKNENENDSAQPQEEIVPNKDMDIDVEINDESGLPEKIEELENQLEDANDKYLRLCAEYDNFRKRTAKEKTELFGDATTKCIEDILPVVDSFERALEAECSDESYKNGMLMIYNQFVENLKKIGVSEMECLGKEFDPNIHNAIKTEEKEDFEENTICEVFQKGYMYGERVVRHAVVAVAQ